MMDQVTMQQVRADELRLGDRIMVADVLSASTHRRDEDRARVDRTIMIEVTVTGLALEGDDVTVEHTHPGMGWIVGQEFTTSQGNAVTVLRDRKHWEDKIKNRSV